MQHFEERKKEVLHQATREALAHQGDARIHHQEDWLNFSNKTLDPKIPM